MPTPNPIATASPKFRSYNDLIRHFEASGKVRTKAYLDSEGIPTIGWGATSYKDGSPVKMGHSISPQQAEDLLRHHSEASVSNLTKLPNWNNFSKHQQDALKSFAYNAGPNFMDSPNFKTMADAIRKGDNAAIGKAFSLYTNGGNAGLARRRQAEADLFNTPVNTPNQQGQYNPNSVGKQGPTFTPGKLGTKYQPQSSTEGVNTEPLKINKSSGAADHLDKSWNKMSLKERYDALESKQKGAGAGYLNTEANKGWGGQSAIGADKNLKRFKNFAVQQAGNKYGAKAMKIGNKFGGPNVSGGGRYNNPAVQRAGNTYGQKAFNVPQSKINTINSIAWG